MRPYHIPVLADACIDGLQIAESGIYVDATFGGGGHSALILQALGPGGKLIGFDQDEDAKRNLPEDERFQFVPNNFRHLKRFLKLYGIREVDGILADLGVSSHQLDEAERGFSFRYEAELDMRMNQQGTLTAAQVLNQYSAADLQSLFSRYGEVRNAKTLAQHIVTQRNIAELRTIGDFLAIIDPLIRGQRQRYLAQVFQAIRIEVNDEMGALKEFLEQSLEVLKPGGRLVVMSYHSLEDRAVKYFLKTGNIEGKVEKDFYGNIDRPFQLITKKAIVPTPEELRENPRSRSVKLRIGEKRATNDK